MVGAGCLFRVVGRSLAGVFWWFVLSCGAHATVARPVVISRKPPQVPSLPIQHIEATSGSGCAGQGEVGTESAAMDRLRFEALGLGADYVQVLDVARSSEARQCNEYRARGIAFKRQSGPGASAAPRARHRPAGSRRLPAAPLGVVITATELIPTSPVRFRPRATRFYPRDGGARTVAVVAEALKDNPALECIVVLGHADEAPREGGDAIARQRGLAVARALVQRGVEPRRLVVGGGALRPSTDPGGPTLSTERRVRFLVDSSPRESRCQAGEPSQAAGSTAPAPPDVIVPPLGAAHRSRSPETCGKDVVRREVKGLLTPWLGTRGVCVADADCAAVSVLQCATSSEPEICVWLAARKDAGDELRVQAARLDSVYDFCGRLSAAEACGQCRSPSVVCRDERCEVRED